MGTNNPRRDSPINRRRMLKTLGFSAGVAGAGVLGGIASANEDDEQFEIVGSEPLSDDEVLEQVEIASENEAVQNFTGRMAERSLEIRLDEAVGVRFETESEEVNQRNPNLIQIPYLADHGESVLHTGLIDTDGGDRLVFPEFGASLEASGAEETTSRHYVFDGLTPVVDRYELIPHPYPLPYLYWPPGWGRCYPYITYWQNGQLYRCYHCWRYLWWRPHHPYWPWHYDWYSYCEQIWP